MFRKEFKKSLRFRFLCVISGLLFVSTVVLSAVVAINEKKMFRRSLATKGQSFASYIAKLSPDPLLLKDYLQLDSIVNEANKDEDIIYTIIQNAHGNIVTSQFASINYQSPRLKAILSELAKESELQDIIAAIQRKEAVTEISVPIIIGADTFGKVTLCMSKQKINQQMIRTILFIIALNLVIAFVLGAVLFVASKKIILTPIAELAHAAARIAKGDLSTRVTVKAAGELQTLVDSFNTMAVDLEKTTVSRQEFQRQTDFLHNVVESLSQPFYVVDVNDYSVKFANSPAAALGDWKNSTCHVLTHRAERPCSNAENHACPLEIVKQTRKPVVLEHIHYDKYGRKKFVEVYGYPIIDRNGNVVQMTEYTVDITDRKEAEERLRTFSKKLQQSNQELQDFAYIASHDLQEPLRKVTAFGDRLKAKYGPSLGEEGGDYLERMRNAATRMHTLINDLLAYSRVTTKAQPFVPVDLNKTAQEVLSDLEVRIEQTRGRVEVDGLPTIDADPLQMRQLIQNLIGNALKFHKKDEPPVVKISGSILNPPSPSFDKGVTGGIFDKVGGGGPLGKMRQDGFSDGFYQITVEDNGIGFDEKYADRIFGVFQRLHGRSEYEGSGIGLAICKKIVERHGGSIAAKSAPNHGATFIVTLPVKQLLGRHGRNEQ